MSWKIRWEFLILIWTVIVLQLSKDSLSPRISKTLIFIYTLRHIILTRFKLYKVMKFKSALKCFLTVSENSSCAGLLCNRRWCRCISQFNFYHIYNKTRNPEYSFQSAWPMVNLWQFQLLYYIHYIFKISQAPFSEVVRPGIRMPVHSVKFI